MTRVAPSPGMGCFQSEARALRAPEGRIPVVLVVGAVLGAFLVGGCLLVAMTVVPMTAAAPAAVAVMASRLPRIRQECDLQHVQVALADVAD